jgi:hypothetical protein
VQGTPFLGIIELSTSLFRREHAPWDSNNMAEPLPPNGATGQAAKSEYEISGSETNSTTTPRRRFGDRDGTTWDASGLETHYKPIESYEGFHRFDPNFDWEPEEERKLVRKVRL